MSAQYGGYQPQGAASAATGPAYRVRLTKVSSYLIVTQQRHATFTGTLEQLEERASSISKHNLLLGWWGVPFGLIWTPLALMRNAKAMGQVRALAAQGQQMPVS